MYMCAAGYTDGDVCVCPLQGRLCSLLLQPCTPLPSPSFLAPTFAFSPNLYSLAPPTLAFSPPILYSLQQLCILFSNLVFFHLTLHTLLQLCILFSNLCRPMASMVAGAWQVMCPTCTSSLPTSFYGNCPGTAVQRESSMTSTSEMAGHFTAKVCLEHKLFVKKILVELVSQN